jgi:hypothetical protein
MTKKKKAWWAPIVHFGVHSLQGSVIFVIIALVALGLGHFVDLLHGWGASQFVVVVFGVLEKTMVVVDAVSFLVYLVRTAYMAIKEW